ncbi:MAG: hypothetical protein DMF61_01840 [Blastocatellia bacterium AA13]|nr:MAG: hypothetical protein DMF61_01840 [Blastocatellia bacterium AA13]
MSLTRLRNRIAPLAFLLVLALSGLVGAQNPTGRPDEPSKAKKPTKAKPKAAPEALSVTLTIITDPAECSVYINGEKRADTNGEGRAQFLKLPLAHYTIEIRKEGYGSTVRGFNAGTESPTLVFKLTAKLDSTVAEFNSLVSSDKLVPPASPNALALLRDLTAKYDDRPEVAQMRRRLADRLVSKADAAVARITNEWRTIGREEIASAREMTATALTLQAEDKRAQSRQAYLNGVLGYRDWLTNRPQTQQSESSEPKQEEGGLLEYARSNLAKAVEWDESWAAAHYQEGIILLAQGNNAGAEAAFVKAAVLEPRWPSIHIGLGAAYYAQMKFKESLAEYQTAAGLDSRSAAAFAGLGLVRGARGDVNGAIKDLQHAMDLDPASALPYFNLGLIYSASKKEKEAAKAVEPLKKAIEMNPLNLEFQNSAAERLLNDLQKRKKK